MKSEYTFHIIMKVYKLHLLLHTPLKTSPLITGSLQAETL